MSANGQEPLRWSGRVVTAEELRRALNGQRRLLVPANAVITPLAIEHLRANGVEIQRGEAAEAPAPPAASWSVAHERADPTIQSVLETLRRDGWPLRDLPAAADTDPARWAHNVAECVAKGECRGAVVFCDDPALVCCVANKLRGLRAAVATTPNQTARLLCALAPNLVAIECAGRTFFELKQMLLTLCRTDSGGCSPRVGRVLEELDGHAHR